MLGVAVMPFGLRDEISLPPIKSHTIIVVWQVVGLLVWPHKVFLEDFLMSKVLRVDRDWWNSKYLVF